MALYIQKNDQRSELQERIAAELQEKARNRQKLQDTPDGVTDSAYIKDTKQTTSLAWAWILIAIAAIAVTIWLVIESAK